MIFVGGGGMGFLLVGIVLLLLFSGGDLFPLLFLAMFFGLPFLFMRSMIRSARRRTPLMTGGWSGQVGYPQAYPPSRPQPSSSWQPPQEPVLPRVSAADVSSLRDRLGHDVISLQPGTDPMARQALADASERHATASTLLERATTDAQLRTAWLAAVEGLQAAQVVRRQLGLDPGPPIPALPSTGPQLTARTHLDVEGRTYAGAPTYEPGHPHWFPGGYYGGRHVPGGWYDAPFWPAALVLGGLSGWAMGGLMAGAMYGDGLDLGGDLGGDVAMGGGDFGGDGGGGDWGGDGGGGDWGGGDFGGFGGGGDWGGGGDFGGGGDW